MFSIMGERVLSQPLASTKIENGDGEERHNHQGEDYVRQEPLLPEASRCSKPPLAVARPLSVTWMLLAGEHCEVQSPKKDRRAILRKW